MRQGRVVGQLAQGNRLVAFNAEFSTQGYPVLTATINCFRPQGPAASPVQTGRVNISGLAFRALHGEYLLSQQSPPLYLCDD